MTPWSALLAGIACIACASALAQPVPDTCRIHYPSDAGIPWTCHRIGRHDTLSGLFGTHWRSVLRFNRIDRRHVYPGVRIKVADDVRRLRDFTPLPTRYAPAAGERKFILVNLTEQFLGAYAHGRLVMSFPITSGNNTDPARRTPAGLFRVSAYDRLHRSSLYNLPRSNTPYPMHYGLRFLVTRQGTAVWIHGRDVPGHAASHGCIGLYDERMQRQYYDTPGDPILEDARELFEWAIAPHSDDGHFHELTDGPPVQIIGQAPDFPPRTVKTAAKPQRHGRVPAAGAASASCGK